MQKIAILIPYFGKWPSYMDVFLESVKKNNLLDIIFFTDLEAIVGAPKNVHFVKLSLKDIVTRIELLFEITLPNVKPYKLCDFRPAYGLIFKEELKNYDFWGYGDNDLIYGDLSLFLNTKTLEEHDVFAFRTDHLHGPFTIYRNNEYVNHLFAKSDLYKSIFLDPNYLSFDEFGRHSFHTDPDLDISKYCDDNISVIALKERKNGKLRLYLQGHSKEVIYKTKDIIVFEDGNVYNQQTKEQYAFYHWVLEKRAIWFKYPEWQEVPKKYYISESGFYNEKQFQYYNLLHGFRKFKGALFWVNLKCLNFIKRKLRMKVSLDTYAKLGFVKSI